MKHVIEAQQFDQSEIEQLFQAADALEGMRSKVLEGKILASLFYEPSTRTRFSFESAMMRLGGEVLTTENAGEFSSVAKGETLEDTIRVVNHYADAIVLRHPEKGSAERAAAVSRVPVINAGDGAGQHPTQALLDLYTIYKALGRTEDLTIGFVGDLKNGRTVRSLAYLLGKYKNIRMVFVSPPELKIGDDIKEYFARQKVSYSERADWNGTLKEVDVLYQTRVQKERFTDAALYERCNGRYTLTPHEVGQMKKEAVIMHPLPRLSEIDTAVDDLPQAWYFRQAGYGVLIRMALLHALIGS